MLKNRSSPSLQFLPTATVAAAAAAVMSLRPSPNYRGGRNQWRSRGFSNRPYAPVTDNDHSDANREFRPDYNPLQPRFHVRPNSDPRSNQNQSFHPRGQSPPPYSNPYQQFAPPTPYNQNQQFRPQGQPQPPFNPNHRFRQPPLPNQRQKQPNGEQNQQFRPPPYQQFAPRRPFGQFRPQQRLRQPSSKPVSDYRNWEHAKPGPPPGCERFTVLSYNILADYLATNHRSKLYFHIPRHILDWEFRRRNIMFELGLWSADILCFQEVDRFQDLEDDLKIRGYNGIWKMRTGEPVDGCAIFWRSSRFKLLHEDAIEFNKFGLRDNVAQICVLELLNEKGPNGSPLPTSSDGCNKVVVCNIHVLYNPKRGEIKLGQVRMLLQKAYAVSKLWDDAPVVLCGDFNSTPKSSLYNFVSERKLNVSELPRDKISGQYSAEIRPKRMFTSSVRTQLSDKTTQSPKRVDETNINDTTHEDEKTTPQLEAKEESEGNDVNCTSEILENISSDAITNDNSDELLESVGDVSVGEDSTSLLTELHGLDGADLVDAEMADGDEISEPDVLEGSLTTDGEPDVENQNHTYDPSGWTPMEIEAATGSSECTTMEHPVKLRSTYTEVEDYSGTRDSNGEPQVTSYHRGFQGTVDYIWRSEGLQTVRVLAPIPKQAMEWTPGFPTKRWGSDHVALVAEFAFNKDVNQEKSEVQ